jgi:hypothetical protein
LIDAEGRVWFRSGLHERELSALDAASAVGDLPGRRLLSRSPAALSALAVKLLPGARPIRVVAFNKTGANNWTLPWHQDRVIALRIEVLERMIFARVHLDPADAENGCLQLALGTHAHGKIAAADADAIANAAPIENCIAERGDVLFAKALILHRSAPSRVSAGRRAIRIDYCVEDLPAPLQWAA